MIYIRNRSIGFPGVASLADRKQMILEKTGLPPVSFGETIKEDFL